LRKNSSQPNIRVVLISLILFVLSVMLVKVFDDDDDNEKSCCPFGTQMAPGVRKGI
jgi:hypothetical protein